jgi:glycosyltransferase involved in cell wall biosynthesis
MPKTIYFAVTNNLTYDQRMARICGSLAKAGYQVVLVGRKTKHLPVLPHQPFLQKRLTVWFSTGKSFYLAYNLQLFFYLLTRKMDAICAIDLDTILPCLLVSKLKRVQRVYDAHELFTEMKEVVSRPAIHKMWLWIEKKAVPQFQNGYTVNQFIQQELHRRYGVDYRIIRNLPLSQQASGANMLQPEEQHIVDNLPSRFFLYQGAVNEGRSFETLIPAMRQVAVPLVIAGDGNFMPEVKKLIWENEVAHKVVLLGAVSPIVLRQITPRAMYGITIFENTGLNQYYSLANRFFDYIQAGIPQLCANYPEYKALNDHYNIAWMIDDLSPASLASALNKLATDRVLYQRLQQNCPTAAQELRWDMEQKVLLSFYQQLLG